MFNANNPDGLLASAAAKAQLGSTEQAIHDQDVLVDAAVDDLRFALGAYDEDRRQLALHGTNRPELLGQNVSNGCVRMANESIDQVMALAPLGTPVTIVA